MYKAMKKNRVIRIPDEKVNEYKKLGYSITDMAGKTVYAPEDNAKKAAALETENADLKAKLEEAAKLAEEDDEKIVALETENADLKEQLAQASKKTSTKKTAAKAAAE